MIIRRADKILDYDKIWKIFKGVIAHGDSLVYDPNTPKESLAKLWFSEGMETFVAEDNQDILGAYFIRPNQIDLGSHIANCGYIVNPLFQKKGIGKMLCESSLHYAKEKGFLGMQFNIVVSTNVTAVNLWQKCGFEIIGTTPKAFRHKTLGLVDTYIMYQDLRTI